MSGNCLLKSSAWDRYWAPSNLWPCHREYRTETRSTTIYITTCHVTEPSCAGIFGKSHSHHSLYYSSWMVLIWITHRQPLTAEGHDVLYFLKATVVQIIFGAKGSVWVVREQPDEFSDHCVRVFNPFPTPSGGFVLWGQRMLHNIHWIRSSLRNHRQHERIDFSSGIFMATSQKQLLHLERLHCIRLRCAKPFLKIYSGRCSSAIYVTPNFYRRK